MRWVAGLGGLLLAGSRGLSAFWISALTGEGVFPGANFGVMLTIAFVVGLVGAGMTTKGQRVESEQAMAPIVALALLGAAVGTGVAGMPVVVSAVLLGCAAIAAVLAWARSRRVTRLLRDGGRAEATFTEVARGSADGTSMYEAVKYAIEFVDEAGLRREVRGERYFPSSRLPNPGDPVTVWYDRDRPARHLVRLPSPDR